MAVLSKCTAEGSLGPSQKGLMASRAMLKSGKGCLGRVVPGLGSSVKKELEILKREDIGSCRYIFMNREEHVIHKRDRR